MASAGGESRREEYINPEKTVRKKTQNYFKKWDYYANPVSLTYKQQKKFATVYGSICSVITLLFLLFYIGTTVADYVVLQKYTRKTSSYAYNDGSSHAMSITNEKVIVATNVYSDNPDIQAELERYVSGMYVKTSASHGSNVQATEFIEAVSCDEMPDFSDIMKSESKGYNCPNLSSFSLETKQIRFN